MELNQVKAIVLGHAVGDALGVPVEFVKREALTKEPVTGMEGYGAFPVPAGAWSDDTSMSLCALDSLAKGAFDSDDVMRNFGLWYYDSEFRQAARNCRLRAGCCTRRGLQDRPPSPYPRQGRLSVCSFAAAPSSNAWLNTHCAYSQNSIYWLLNSLEIVSVCFLPSWKN